MLKNSSTFDNNQWVVRDFLQLSGNSSKREVEDDEIYPISKDKKPKLETLNLCLSLPDVSLSLAASNHVQFLNGEPLNPSKSLSLQSLPTNSNTTQTTFSTDFTAGSMSFSCSHPFSHNPSCSMTRNSTENSRIWNGGEGTNNGSVHSRFRPVGDGGVVLVQSDRTNSDSNLSLFPSELLARPGIDTQSGDSIGRGFKNSNPSRPEKIFPDTDSVSEFPTSILPSTVVPPSKPRFQMINNNNMMIEDEWSVKSTKKDRFDSVESLVRIKEAEARMFQKKADEARKEAEGYKRMIKIKIEKLDEEYTEKLSKLCLNESEERKKQKVEEFKVLENGDCEYYKMKMRMQAEIAGLLQRMENTKKQWV